MIFIVITLFVIVATIRRILRGLTAKQAFYMFIIYLCVGMTLRAILFMFGV
jgi:hypothetical protein